MLYEEVIRQLTLDVGEDQGVQPPRAPFIPRQPGGALVDRAVLGLVERGGDDGGDLVGRGRLVQVGAHLLEQLGVDRLLAALVVPDLIDQPRGELHHVGAGALVPAGQVPQLGAVPLGGLGGAVVRGRLADVDADLAGAVLDVDGSPGQGLGVCTAASGTPTTTPCRRST
ncbi:hypothetical protein OG467_40890 [Streptomyces sp. NBC_01361]|nr:hypothetical protein [Streptomyces sp. NBC_01361]